MAGGFKIAETGDGGKNLESKKYINDEIDELPDFDDEDNAVDFLPEIADEGDEIDELPDFDVEAPDKSLARRGENHDTKIASFLDTHIQWKPSKEVLDFVKEKLTVLSTEGSWNIASEMSLRDIAPLVKNKLVKEAVDSIIYFEAVKTAWTLCGWKEMANNTIRIGESILGKKNEKLDAFVEHDIRPEINQFMKEHFDKPKLVEFAEKKIGKITGADDFEILQAVEDFQVGSVKASAYLALKMGAGVCKCGEEIAKFVVGTPAHLMGHDEIAKAVYDKHYVGQFSARVDEVFGAQGFMKSIGDSVEMFGETATKIGLHMLAAQVSAPIAAMVSATIFAMEAGNATQNAVEKTGEFSNKEFLYGVAIGGAVYGAGKLAKVINVESVKQIGGLENTMQKLFVNSGISKHMAGLFMAGVEGAGISAIYAIPMEVIKYVQDKLGWNVDSSADWSSVPPKLLMGGLMGMATYGVREGVKGVQKVNGGEVDQQPDALQDKYSDASSQEKPELKKIEPQIEIEFKCPEGVDQEEFKRQLKAQERGLNSQTVAENMDNRAAFEKRKLETGNGRDLKAGEEAQRIARQKALQSRVESNQSKGMSYGEAKAEAQAWLQTRAALHNPDQIAGGNPSKVSRMGDAKVNASIGAQWKTRVAQLADCVNDYAQDKTAEELEKIKMNVKLVVK